jgi:hypothetical protein
MRFATISLTALSTNAVEIGSRADAGQRSAPARPGCVRGSQQAADVSLEAADASHVTHALALRPAAQGGELAPAPRPAPVPQAPLRAFQVADRAMGEGHISRAHPEAAGRLQRVLEADRGVPPVQRERGTRQHLALQPPQPGIAVAQHGRRRIRTHSSRGERLPERLDRSRLAVAGEGEAVLDAMSVDHLARDHLEVALFPPVPAAHIATIEPNHDGSDRLRCGPLHGPGRVRLHDVLADPQRPVPHRARVPRPADREQLGQERGDLAERAPAPRTGP